jgi:hypothetical protein
LGIFDLGFWISNFKSSYLILDFRLPISDWHFRGSIEELKSQIFDFGLTGSATRSIQSFPRKVVTPAQAAGIHCIRRHRTHCQERDVCATCGTALIPTADQVSRVWRVATSSDISKSLEWNSPARSIVHQR